MNRLFYLDQFKNQLVNFMDELISQYPKEADFVIFRICLKDKIPIENIMEYFIKNMLPLSGMIKIRDEEFFLNKNTFFSQFGGDKVESVNYFKHMWKNLNNEDKDTLWKWFSLFIKLSKAYIKSKK